MNRKELAIFVTQMISALQAYYENTAAPAGPEQPNRP